MKKNNKKGKDIFTKGFIKELEKLFRNCDEKVSKLAVEKLTKEPLN